MLRDLPPELWLAPARGEPPRWLAEPVRLRQLCDASAHALVALPAGTPSLKLLADQSFTVLSGISDALDGLALQVADPTRRRSCRGHVAPYIPDWAPALVNPGRAYAAIVPVEFFWTTSAWPTGAVAITWTAISVIYFASKVDKAYSSAMSFGAGTGLAAIFVFAALPSVETFAGFSIAMGLFLVPVGSLVAQPLQATAHSVRCTSPVDLSIRTRRQDWSLSISRT